MENFDKDLTSIQEARNLAKKGHQASLELATFSQEKIDAILKAMSVAGEEHAVELAKLAVEDTGFGNVPDKTYKNHAASTLLYEQIKDEKTVGIIKKDPELKTMDVAQPIGLVMGIVPSTNPTSTVIFKSMIALKSRNAIVFAPHPAAAKCTFRAAEIMNDAAKAAGAPDNVVTCVSTTTMGSTNELMHSKEVGLIIATGGPGMVKAAYSSGKPAIGVGAGNSPSYIERSADVKDAVAKIIASKSFDYGTICASEQSIICESCNEAEVVSELEKQGGYFMSEAETEAVCKLLFKNGGHAMDAKFVGRSPQVISQAAGFTVPDSIKILIGRQKGVGEGNPLSYEKLTSVLAFYVVEDWQEACQLSIDLLQNGIGHTMNLHTNREDIVLKFAAKPASRILVNTGGSQGGTGISTGLPISFTLGCGTLGGSSVSENVSPKHLLNIKKVAYGLKDVTTLVQDDKSFNHPELKSQVKQCLNDHKCDHTVEKATKNMSDKDLELLTELVRKTLSEMKA
ncbi:acetaldehyde dehydrogenase (acetylating) [Companilactobacillus suantsaicola]|uniref:Acetaldehyde dehydrogenase (Acetylating) n=1 Tax=Companilactobacillus suantsaicola TaxID=2487723 RepID=A0A4Z0JRQ5_9LACO|nr:acetaldehyde dehydrogenase (acetylating) [Companilactobacillus suantsaicola]TGD24846.1 acetaldehyde dehydrogenase (acetylating) [Companilactobacillus suantsaicola]